MGFINKYIYSEKGEASLIAIVKFFLLLTVIGFGVEFVKIQTMQKTLQTNIEIIASDSLEINVLDKYRREHVSIVEADSVIYTFYDLLKTELNLNDSLEPIHKDIGIEKIHIETLRVEEGEFVQYGTKISNTSYPKIIISGYTKRGLPMLALFTDIKVEIPFYVECINERTE